MFKVRFPNKSKLLLTKLLNKLFINNSHRFNKFSNLNKFNMYSHKCSK